MAATIPFTRTLAELARGAGRWAAGWWRVVHLGALLLALALSPSSYGESNRRALARHVYLGTAPALLPFAVLATLLSLIVIRIVLVTAVSYGLSQYALEMVVRVLVLELIPLTAALFAALRSSFPLAAQIGALRARGDWERSLREGGNPMRDEVLPRVGAGVFCALLLAAVSCVVTLVLAYVSVYGFTLAGFDAYTHTVGRVFGPGVSLIFGLKIVFFGITVALMPIASVLDDTPRPDAGVSSELRGLVRMFLVIVLIEAASLVGNYY
ncbi:MAG TPA: ABC transporter permease [Albitalea sp.]|nr:ABC transporter permease [Albitalea sp.]